MKEASLFYFTLNFFVNSRRSSAICSSVAEDVLISSIEASCSSADAAMSWIPAVLSLDTSAIS
ncbi:hypothetical protein CHCC15087_1869 [Bacillus licheniformis]|nr:hypothetical protein CHCC15087_1869 [Bacillus licheniformis]